MNPQLSTLSSNHEQREHPGSDQQIQDERRQPPERSRHLIMEGDVLGSDDLDGRINLGRLGRHEGKWGLGISR